MKTNIRFIILIVFLVFLAVSLIGFCYLKFGVKKSEVGERIGAKAKGIMILIEYKDTIGLSNFVNEMYKRGIHGLLQVNPEFVQANCDVIKQLPKYNIEIMASNDGAPFWDMPYEQQKARIVEMKEKIEACTGVPVRAIGSRYMASDMTTIKVAEELGIPYVIARGTTDSKATVYQIEGYNAKILSVSNIPKVQYKYGSLCDYSYYERNGTPNDMMNELMRAIEPLTPKEQARYGSYLRVTPVSHTNIGGYLKPWMDMWLKFWDMTKDKIDWVGLDEFMKDADWVLPDWQLPINKNAPYTPEKIRPLVPYEEVEKIQNPCKVEDIGGTGSEKNEQASVGNKIMMFHNGKGQMCLEAFEFIKTINYPIEQFLDYEEGFGDKLNKLKTEFARSEGVSETFRYYPIIFIKDRAFSGFNEEIKNEILKEIKE